MKRRADEENDEDDYFEDELSDENVMVDADAVDEDLLTGDDEDYNDDDDLQMEPFHMKQEMGEGFFDKATGSYVLHEQQDGEDSSDDFEDQEWLDVSKKEMDAARMAQETRQRDEHMDTYDSKTTAIEELTSLLLPDETPLEALQRLGNLSGMQTRRVGRKTTAIQLTEEEQKRSDIAKQSISRITELCSLVDLADCDVYEMTRELILRHSC